jgi:hypothetical protein
MAPSIAIGLPGNCPDSEVCRCLKVKFGQLTLAFAALNYRVATVATGAMWRGVLKARPA